MKNTIALLAVASLLIGCSNPADDVPEAEVKPATETPDTTVATTPAKTGKIYSFTPESKIDFVGSKVTGSHNGGFKLFTGQFAVVEGQLAPNQVIKIDTTSLWSDNDKLTEHLKSEDFFDVAKFPTATFSTTAITQTGPSHTITGNLTLHGVTKSISFPAAVLITDEQVSVNSEFSINRMDFGIKFTGRQDDLIREEVVIKLNIVARTTSA